MASISKRAVLITCFWIIYRAAFAGAVIFFAIYVSFMLQTLVADALMKFHGRNSRLAELQLIESAFCRQKKTPPDRPAFVAMVLETCKGNKEVSQLL